MARIGRSSGRRVGFYHGTLLPAGAAVLVSTAALFQIYMAFSLVYPLVLANQFLRYNYFKLKYGGRGVRLYQGTLLPAGAAVLVSALFIMYKAFSLSEQVILAIFGQPGLMLQLFPLETIVTSNLIGQNRP